MGFLECVLITANSTRSPLIKSILFFRLMTCFINAKGRATFQKLTSDYGITNLGSEEMMHRRRPFKVDMGTMSSL